MNDTDLIALDARRTDAMVAGDFTLLDRLIAGDCRYVHSHSGMDTKASYLASLASKAVRYTWIKTSEHQIYPLGNAYLIAHRMDAELHLGGVRRDYRSRACVVWRLDGTELRLACFQATAIP